MPSPLLQRLDLASKVTIHIFAGQLAIGAIMAALSPKAFMPAFGLVLLYFAAIQSMLALGARQRAPATSLTEWDGVSWLLLVATGCFILAR